MKRSVLFMTVLLVLCPRSFGAEQPGSITCRQWIERLETVQNMIRFNLANVLTTRTPEGGAFQFRGLSCNEDGTACEVKAFKKTKFVYEPGHPDANIDGYVEYPDIDVAGQLIELGHTIRDLRAARSSCR